MFHYKLTLLALLPLLFAAPNPHMPEATPGVTTCPAPVVSTVVSTSVSTCYETKTETLPAVTVPTTVVTTQTSVTTQAVTATVSQDCQITCSARTIQPSAGPSSSGLDGAALPPRSLPTAM
jgi:hypothetical protein